MKKLTLFLCFIACMLTSSSVYAQVVSVSPDSVEIGQTLNVEITTENINLTQGSNINKVTLIQGFFTKYFYVYNATTNNLSFNATFTSDYPTGNYDVTVTNVYTGTEVSGSNMLYISPQSNDPYIADITGLSGQQGDTIIMTIYGGNTHFDTANNEVYLHNGSSYVYPTSIDVTDSVTIAAKFIFPSSQATGVYYIYPSNDVDGALSTTKTFTLSAGINGDPAIVSISP